MKKGWGLIQDENGNVSDEETSLIKPSAIGQYDEEDEDGNIVSQGEEEEETIIRQGSAIGQYDEEDEDGNIVNRSGETTKEVKEETPVETNPFKSIYQDLSDKGIIEIGEDDEFTGTQEEMIELLSKVAEKKVDSKFDDMLSSLPKENAEVIRAIRNGASLEDAYNLSQQEVDYESVDLEDANNQANIVGTYLESQGFSEESINRKISSFYKGGTLKEEALEYREKLQKAQEKTKEEFYSNLKKENEEAEARQIEESKEFRESVTSMRSIGGFDVSEQEANELYDFITKVDKDGKTEFEKQDNDEVRLLHALFVKNGMNKDKLTKDIVKKESFKIKRQIDNVKDTKALSRSQSIQKEESEFVPLSELSFKYGN